MGKITEYRNNVCVSQIEAIFQSEFFHSAYGFVCKHQTVVA